jgi:hypothetical protein
MSTLAVHAGFSIGEILAKKFVEERESCISVLLEGHVQILPRGSSYSIRQPHIFERWSGRYFTRRLDSFESSNSSEILHLLNGDDQ